MISIALCAALALLLFTATLLEAQQKLRAGVAVPSYFLNMENAPARSAVDIWGKIEAENGWLFDCIRSDSMQDCIAAIADESMEILVGHPPIND